MVKVKNINTISLENTTYQNKSVLVGVNLANVPWTNNSMVNAFNNCSNLEYVTNINENVTNMSKAFSLCTKLTNVETIPNSVTNMHSCFDHCSSLIDAPSLPEDVEDLSYSFFYCKKLIDSSDLSNLSNAANMSNIFSGCIELSNVSSLPNNVQDLSYGFSLCYNLENAPDLTNAQSITNMAGTFSACTKLKDDNLVIPNNVINMYSAFDSCSNIGNTPSIPNTVIDMRGTFRGCSKISQAPVIPNGVTSLSNTFYGCSNLTETPILSDNILSLANAFYNCVKLPESPHIPNNVGDMSGAFYNCKLIPSVEELPSSVGNMQSTYQLCSNLIGDIYIRSSNISSAINCFNGTSELKNVYIPFTQSGVYTSTYNAFTNAGYPVSEPRVNGVLLKDINGWRYTFDQNNHQILQEYLGSDTTIYPLTGSNVLYGDCTSNEFVNARDSNSPFYNNQNVITAELEFKEWVNNSMAFAFYNDANVQYIYNISPNVTNYHRAFEGCTNLIAITIPYTFYEEGSDNTDAFAGATNLQTINIIFDNRPVDPNTPAPNVPTTNSIAGAFADTSITVLPIIPNTVTNISHSFTNTHISEIPPSGIPISTVNMQASFMGTKVVHIPTLPPSVEDLSWAFANCYDLETVANFPVNVVNMQGTFYDDYNLTSYTDIRSNRLTDMSLCFWNCQNLTSFGTITSKQLTNMYETFYNCTNMITAPMIPSGVVNANGLFDGCSNLTGDVYIRSEIVNDASNCFNNTSLEKNVHIPFFYSNNTYSETYNSFINAGYSDVERINGVLLIDASGYDIDLDDWRYNIDDDNNVKLEAFIGENPQIINVPFVRR